MFDIEKEQNRLNKKVKILNIVLFTIIKLIIAYCLVTYLEYGLFIVIGYILYALENIANLQYINSREINLQINILHERINKIKELKNNN
ncbi:MAG: hypothetical protein RBR65_05520 [Aliarcobacter sp.]|nr:hypothetical protein [Aliarcobacter sp.]